MKLPDPIRVYRVGGAVRDGLLGLPVQDRDYVVVGATPEDMSRLGFQPVGKDFPVFLHPDTHEEYALARTERKTARGYKGFQVHAAPDVTLEEDLIRRDLTINAMAMDAEGLVIDPYHGQEDLRAGILRHVSAAFAEDPVRILRVARFAARFPRFEIAPETLALMAAMVENGEIDALVPERVWQEIARGLMEATPSRLFLSLRACGALARLLPEIDRLFGIPQNPETHPEIDTGEHVMRVIDIAADMRLSLEARFAALVHDLGKGLTPPEKWPRHDGHEERGVDAVKALAKRIKAPSDCRELALAVARWHGQAHAALQLDAAARLDVLEKTDAFRRPERFAQFLLACEADYRGRPGWGERPYEQARCLRDALVAANGIDAAAIAREAEAGAIPAAIRQARVEAIARSEARPS